MSSKPLGTTAVMLVSLLFASALMSCDHVDALDQSGELVLSYSLYDDDVSCDAAGISKIRAVLGDGSYTQEVECGQETLRIDGLEPGSYDLAIYGVNAEGVSSMDSLADGLMTVDILPGEVTDLATPIVLTDAPVRLHLRWKMGWGDCNSTDIFRFRIEAFDETGTNNILTTTLFCWTSGAAPDFFREAPDPGRALTDPDLAMIKVTPLDHSGTEVGTLGPVVFDEFENPGPGEAIEMSIECSTYGCDFPGECI